MSPLKIEISILILVLFFTTLIVFRNFHTRKNTFPIAFVILVLIDAFILIHMFFCYQVGFPASITQDASTDLTLTSSDWLGFLGGYLGFAGSLVMAYLVYRQSNVIAELTISEYVPSTSLFIKKSVNSTEYMDYKEEFIDTNITQNIPGVQNEQYYSYHCVLIENSEVECENFINLVFIELTNNSKLPISNLSFLSIEIESIANSCKKFTFSNRAGIWDPADKITEILPGKQLRRCFILERIPEEIDISWMTIKFSCGEKKVLVSKTKGAALAFLSVSE